MSNVARPGSVSVTTAATKILGPNNDRTHLILTKNSSQDLFLGCNSTVTSTSSFQFSGACGTILRLPNFRGALWAIAGGSTITYLEITE
jgi:hypothetical protein